MFSSTAFNIISPLAAQFLFEMGKQSYLSLLILCTVLSQGIAILSGENIGKWQFCLPSAPTVLFHFSITTMFNFLLLWVPQF